MNINKLIRKYEKNRDYYVSPKYNESQLRVDFLDPFFELLGWDITNRNAISTNEREVLIEESLKDAESTNTKKPDYTFRLFSDRKFFLEAKKPSVNIHENRQPALQVRRYGFSAKLKISVLSNFEYLCIYDCSHEVSGDDATKKGLIKCYHYQQYEECFDEIYEYLSRESVYTGKFEENWKDIEERLQLFNIDILFLKQINEWRIILGKEILKHNQHIDEHELNDTVQSYINSIIFLRVCEDRSLEEYKTLLNYADKKDFLSLVHKIKESDKKYNANLFSYIHSDKMIINESSAFWTIIKQLYYPESTYSFSVISANILGNIYEMLLTEQLEISNNTVTLEKKPDKVDRDIVTTPIHIVKELLKKTIDEHLQQPSKDSIFELKLIDISCGSGVFLLEAFQLVQDKLIDYYLRVKPTKLIQTATNSYKLPYLIKKRILESIIYGIDVDYNAVQACQFGLLLKLLEDEHNSDLTVPALPDLSQNIHFGNSLISYEMTKDEGSSQINPFSFDGKKFDVVVGNPPYMSTQQMKEFNSNELPLYKQHYYTSYKQFDKYFLFIERGYELLKDGGYLGYIIPSKFMKVGAAKKLREFLIKSHSISEITSFGANQLFTDKTTYTALLILQKYCRDSFQFNEVRNLSDWVIKGIDTDSPATIIIDDLSSDTWVLVDDKLRPVLERLIEQSTTLEAIAGEHGISNGIQTSANRIYIHSQVDEDKNYYYFLENEELWKVEKKCTRPYYKTTSKENNLNTYRILKPNAFVIYPYEKVDNIIQLISYNRLIKEYPYLHKYLLSHKSTLASERRDIKPTPESEDEWYRYGRHQSLDKCEVPEKIVVGVLSQGDKYAIDRSQTLISSGGTAGYCMITLPEDSQYSIYFIQAILNSKYVEWYAFLSGEVFRGGYIARGTKVLKNLPIREIDFTQEDDAKIHDEISMIQKRLIAIQKSIDEVSNDGRKRIILERKFSHHKQELDNTIKKLYNLKEYENLIPLVSDLYA